MLRKNNLYSYKTFLGYSLTFILVIIWTGCDFILYLYIKRIKSCMNLV